MSDINVLFVGESWFYETTEYKGFDSFTTSGYQTAVQWIQKAIEGDGIKFTHIPCHEVSVRFPKTIEEIKAYDVILFSDVGANTFLLHPDTFLAGKTTPNLLNLIKDYVYEGGAFGMIGGYLTFQGFEAKGHYKGTVIEDILPVTLLDGDDRVELPQGYSMRISLTNHPIVQGVPEQFPNILGYNKLKAKEDAVVLASRGDDALISIRQYGEGRTFAYATDCSPHWACMELCEWEFYPVFWKNVVHWMAGR